MIQNAAISYILVQMMALLMKFIGRNRKSNVIKGGAPTPS
jgi:hypothetical protein